MVKFITISLDTFSLQYQAAVMNEQYVDAIKSTGVDQFRWNCISVVKITSLMDVLDNSSLGCVASVIVGRHSKGYFSARGKKGTSDGCVVISSAADVFRCFPGTTRWFLVRFARMPKEDHCDG